MHWIFPVVSSGQAYFVFVLAVVAGDLSWSLNEARAISRRKWERITATQRDPEQTTGPN